MIGSENKYNIFEDHNSIFYVDLNHLKYKSYIFKCIFIVFLVYYIHFN